MDQERGAEGCGTAGPGGEGGGGSGVLFELSGDSDGEEELD